MRKWKRDLRGEELKRLRQGVAGGEGKRYARTLDLAERG